MSTQAKMVLILQFMLVAQFGAFAAPLGAPIAGTVDFLVAQRRTPLELVHSQGAPRAIDLSPSLSNQYKSRNYGNKKVHKENVSPFPHTSNIQSEGDSKKLPGNVPVIHIPNNEETSDSLSESFLDMIPKSLLDSNKRVRPLKIHIIEHDDYIDYEVEFIELEEDTTNYQEEYIDIIYDDDNDKLQTSDNTEKVEDVTMSPNIRFEKLLSDARNRHSFQKFETHGSATEHKKHMSSTLRTLATTIEPSTRRSIYSGRRKSQYSYNPFSLRRRPEKRIKLDRQITTKTTTHTNKPSNTFTSRIMTHTNTPNKGEVKDIFEYVTRTLKETTSKRPITRTTGYLNTVNKPVTTTLRPQMSTNPFTLSEENKDIVTQSVKNTRKPIKTTSFSTKVTHKTTTPSNIPYNTMENKLLTSKTFSPRIDLTTSTISSVKDSTRSIQGVEIMTTLLSTTMDNSNNNKPTLSISKENSSVERVTTTNAYSDTSAEMINETTLPQFLLDSKSIVNDYMTTVISDAEHIAITQNPIDDFTHIANQIPTRIPRGPSFSSDDLNSYNLLPASPVKSKGNVYSQPLTQTTVKYNNTPTINWKATAHINPTTESNQENSEIEITTFSQEAINKGFYHEINPGQYHEINPGQYHEVNPGQYHEVNPGQYHGEQHDEKQSSGKIGVDNVSVDFNHGQEKHTQIYNLKANAGEYIIGEVGRIDVNSGQTLEGVRYTAVEGEVDLAKISHILESFFGARTS